MMPGAVALAADTGAPLVPMVIWGPQRIYTADLPRDLTRGRPVSLLVGSPSYVGRDADVVAETRRLGRTLQALLDDVQARPQHQPAPGGARALASGTPGRACTDRGRGSAVRERAASIGPTALDGCDLVTERADGIDDGIESTRNGGSRQRQRECHPGGAHEDEGRKRMAR